MSRSVPHSRIAIVGNGIGALVAQSVFRAEGLSADQICVYGEQRDTFGNFRSYTRAIQQDRMRSESSGHFFPSDFPGMALLESVRRRTPLPLLRSLLDRYQPTLDDLLDHGAAVANALEAARSFVPARVGQVARVDEAVFALRDEAGQNLATAQHVILALGHPGLWWPPILSDWRKDQRVAHAYEPKLYRAGELVLVIGRGMAAAHEWLAALRADCRVMAISRHPLHHQALNAPRCDFSAAGLDRYRRLGPSERHAYLDGLASGTYPWRPEWEREFERARRSGSLRMVQAEVLSVAQQHDPSDLHRRAEGLRPSAGKPDELLMLRLSNGDFVWADRITAATGFTPDSGAHPLIARMADSEGVALERGRLIIDDNFCVPLTSRSGSCLSVIGNLARWALPVADTFAGMKYVARRLLPLLGIRMEPFMRLQFQLRLSGLRF
jgi:cation diffusion facilitator CzcD-associated flavoprotein CzcO